MTMCDCVGPFQLSPEQIYIGIVCDLITFVPSLVIVWLFRHLRSRRSPYQNWVLHYHQKLVLQPALSTLQPPDRKLKFDPIDGSSRNAATEPVPGTKADQAATSDSDAALEHQVYEQIARGATTGECLRSESQRNGPPSLDQIVAALNDDRYSTAGFVHTSDILLFCIQSAPKHIALS